MVEQAYPSGPEDDVGRIGWIGAALLALAPQGGRAETPLEPAPWIEKMVTALRPGETMGAHIAAWTKDETGSERRFEIELLRQSRPGRLVAVVEMREEGTPAPGVLKIESPDGGELASWSWDVRFQRFVRMRGLKGTEVFAGTHFRLEDLGFTDLRTRKAGSARRTERDGRELVALSSPPYHYYGRVVTHVDPSTRLPAVVDVYDHTQARIRELRFDGVEAFAGHPFPTRLAFRDEITLAETRLVFDWIRVGLTVRAEDLDLEELERRIQGGEDPVRLPR